jgi:1-acyl-sn-glycerol-3-phosphate acyltransferase
MNVLRGVTALFLIVLTLLLGCIPLYLIGLLRIPLRGGARRAMNRAMDAIVQVWVAAHRLTFAALGVTRIDVTWPEDTELSPDGWYLVLSNHQSWADILILQNIFWGRIPILKFFTKRQLIWVPLLGLAMWFLGFPYVRRLPREQIAADPSLAALDRQATVNACQGFRDHPTSVLSFLEGTRFTAAKHEAQDSRFQRLLNPKLGGVSYVVTALSDRLDGVLDVTLTYPDGIPTIWELLQGHCPRVNAVVAARGLPPGVAGVSDPDQVREHLRPWVEAIWQQKDERLRNAEKLAN